MKNYTQEELNKLDKDRKIRMGYDENITPETLTRLSLDSDRDVRVVVALNPDTYTSVLEKMASDKDIYVRAAVATNVGSTFDDTIDKLLKEEAIFRMLLNASRTSKNQYMLDRLSESPNDMIRENVASNKNANVNILYYLSNSNNQTVAKKAKDNMASRPDLPPPYDFIL